jgi:hypothetical protein
MTGFMFPHKPPFAWGGPQKYSGAALVSCDASFAQVDYILLWCGCRGLPGACSASHALPGTPKTSALAVVARV